MHLRSDIALRGSSERFFLEGRVPREEGKSPLNRKNRTKFRFSIDKECFLW